MITIAEFERRNRELWADQTRLRDLRMQNRLISQAALELLREQETLSVPVRSRLTLERALEREDRLRKDILAEARAEPDAAITRQALSRNGRIGGSSPKAADQLQQFILDLLTRKPCTTVIELEHELGRYSGPGNQFEIEGDYIHYSLADGRSKKVRLRALKDRLSRAKKARRSR